MPSYVVLVSLDRGTTWARYPDPVEAATPQAAAEQLRENDPTLKGQEDVQFLALASFAPIAKKREMVERWSWAKVEEPEGQQELTPDA